MSRFESPQPKHLRSFLSLGIGQKRRGQAERRQLTGPKTVAVQSAEASTSFKLSTSGGLLFAGEATDGGARLEDLCASLRDTRSLHCVSLAGFPNGQQDQQGKDLQPRCGRSVAMGSSGVVSFFKIV